MEKLYEKMKHHWQDCCNLLLGVWLIISPSVLEFTGVNYAAANSYIPGIVIAVAAASALVAFQEWEEWVNIVLGLWLIASPWLLEFATTSFSAEAQAAFTATWNVIIVGLLVTGLAGWSTHSMRKYDELAT